MLDGMSRHNVATTLMRCSGPYPDLSGIVGLDVLHGNSLTCERGGPALPLVPRYLNRVHRPA
jgi:hypothetical protein